MNGDPNEINDSELKKHGFARIPAELWYNSDLGIYLMPNGTGYLPKYWPPLMEFKPDSENLLPSVDGIMIADVEGLKNLLEGVRQLRPKK